jgi:hypothetical protein
LWTPLRKRPRRISSKGFMRPLVNPLVSKVKKIPSTSRNSSPKNSHLFKNQWPPKAKAVSNPANLLLFHHSTRTEADISPFLRYTKSRTKRGAKDVKAEAFQ